MPIGSATGGGGSSKSAIEAGEASVKLSANDSALQKTLNNVVSRLRKTASVMKGIGAGAMVAGGATLAPMLKLFHSFAEEGDKIFKTAERLRASTEAVSAMGYAAQQSGSSIEDLASAGVKLQKATIAAGNGAQDQSDAFKALGINVEEFGAMDIDQKFLAIAGGLDQIGDDITKDTILFSLFGKSAANLIPLFNSGADGLKELLDEAERTGKVMNREDAKNSVIVLDSMDRVLTALKTTVLEIGASFLNFTGNIDESSQVIVDFIKTIRTWIKENRILVTVIAAVSAAVVALGVTFVVVGTAITGFIATIAAIKALIVGLISIAFSPLLIKLALIAAAIGGLAYLFLNFTSIGRTLKDEFIKSWNSIKETFLLAWEGIGAALAKGDFKLAMDILWQGIKIIWKEGILFLSKLWNEFKTEFINTFSDMGLQIKIIWENLWVDIQLALNNAMSAVKKQLAAIEERLGIGRSGLRESDIEAGRVLLENAIRRKGEKIIAPLEQELGKRRAARAAELGAAMEEGLQPQIKEIQEMKDRLQVLVDEAKKPKEAKPDEKKAEKDGAARTGVAFAKAIRGTFSSADYRGAFRLIGNDEAKKQTGLQKQMLGELKGINAKVGDGMEFE